MPRWLHIIVQLGSIGGGIFGSLHGVSWAPIAAMVVNSAVGVIQQSYNTDGTPQETAFISKSSTVVKSAEPNQ